MISNPKFFPESKKQKNDLEKLKEQFFNIVSNPQIGFFDLPLKLDAAQECFERGKKWSVKRHHFYHVGIGGSALGPEMLVSALVPNKKNITFLNNIDPEDMEYKLNDHDPKDSLYYIVSKSGTTAETMATLAIICNLLLSKGIPESHFKDHLVFCTDPASGDLRELSKKYQIECFDIPTNVGGRYSVLSPVGFFPFAFLGGDPRSLIEGALKQRETTLSDLSMFEISHFLFDQSLLGKTQNVIIPYSSLLKNFSHWFVQLWAESLGKNNKGLTPIPAYGATDQHSQMQLFMEGPQDKVMLIITVDEPKTDFPLKTSIESKMLNQLSLVSLQQLMTAERKGTIQALCEVGRPNIEICLPKITAETLGALILWAEALTVSTSILLEVDPFNQPGVELGKTNTWKILKEII